MTPWQPRVISDTSWVIEEVAPPAPRRIAIAKMAATLRLQSGYIGRTILRLAFSGIALWSMPISTAFAVVAIMVGAQFMADEPAAPQLPKRPLLRSI